MTGKRQIRWRSGCARFRALGRFGDKGGWVMSSHVAMSVMMALFPFVLFVVALAGSLSRDIPVDDLFTLLLGSWPQEVAAPIERELRAVWQPPIRVDDAGRGAGALFRLQRGRGGAGGDGAGLSRHRSAPLLAAAAALSGIGHRGRGAGAGRDRGRRGLADLFQHAAQRGAGRGDLLVHRGRVSWIFVAAAPVLGWLRFTCSCPGGATGCARSCRGSF